MGIVIAGLFLANPVDKSPNFIVFQKAFDGMKIPGQFFFGEHGMNFVMTDAMHANGLLSTMASRNQVMLINGRAVNQLSTAKRAIIHRLIVRRRSMEVVGTYDDYATKGGAPGGLAQVEKQ